MIDRGIKKKSVSLRDFQLHASQYMKELQELDYIVLTQYNKEVAIISKGVTMDVKGKLHEEVVVSTSEAQPEIQKIIDEEIKGTPKMLRPRQMKEVGKKLEREYCKHAARIGLCKFNCK